VHLLSPGQSVPVQTWQFEDHPVVRIGRAPEADVTVPDAYVSREHARLTFREGRWVLESLGRNGVYIAGRAVQDLPLWDTAEFQLGIQGPALRFHDRPSESNISTLCADAAILMDLKVDPQVRDEQVNEVVETDYFASLKQNLKRLRGGGSGGESSR
jgi:pSer/pThr/pTyr-binding forkhead associated (FHA) protein